MAHPFDSPGTPKIRRSRLEYKIEALPSYGIILPAEVLGLYGESALDRKSPIQVYCEPDLRPFGGKQTAGTVSQVFAG